MTTLLHTNEGDSILHKFLEEVLLHGLLDTLKIVAFLLVTYLIMEFIEHRASSKTRRLLERSGPLGPALGGLLGAVPQCGFSASASNFFCARVITLGTLIAIFLSTSDEMIPIMISNKMSAGAIFAILGYKVAVGMLVGFTVDFTLRLFKIKREAINIDEMCGDNNCHCERGILRSALHHTLTVGGFVLIITFAINTLILFVGTDNIAKIIYDLPVISHLISAIFGLIPNCAASVALTNLCLGGIISAGTMLSGLFSGAGVGLLILFKVNKKVKENLIIIGILILAGTLFGFIADLLNFSSLLQ